MTNSKTKFKGYTIEKLDDESFAIYDANDSFVNMAFDIAAAQEDIDMEIAISQAAA